jgi:hypothetical protein
MLSDSGLAGGPAPAPSERVRPDRNDLAGDADLVDLATSSRGPGRDGAGPDVEAGQNEAATEPPGPIALEVPNSILSVV